MKPIFTIKHIVLVCSLMLLIFCVPNLALAAQDYISLGDMAGNIYGGTSIIMRLMWAACLIVGVVLLLTAFTQYQTHRRNPKLVPLTTTVTYLILGIIAFTIPFLEEVFYFDSAMPTQQVSPAAPQSVPSSSYIDIDK